MWELAANVILWWSSVIAIVFAVGISRTTVVSTFWLLFAVTIFAIYAAANKFGASILSFDGIFHGARFNWEGKIVELGAILVIVFLMRVVFRSIKLRDHGLTLVQKKGSTIPSLAMAALLVASMIALTTIFGDRSDADMEQIIETIMFQMSLPGLSEEPMFRGVLTTALTIAVPSRGINILGARIGWGGLLSTLLFASVHGIFWADGGIQWSVVSLIVTSFLGFGLLWIRQRTGSLAIPIFTHNLINSASSFVEFFT